MGKRTRNQYSDEFRASALLMLESQGYPDTRGALQSVADHLHIPKSTLHGWYNSEHSPVPPQLRTLKRREIKEIIRDEIYSIFEKASVPRDFASYKDLMTSVGILVDKLLALEGKPTARIAIDDWRSQAIEYIKAGELTFEALANEFDPDLATELFRSAGVPIEPSAIDASLGQEP